MNKTKEEEIAKKLHFHFGYLYNEREEKIKPMEIVEFLAKSISQEQEGRIKELEENFEKLLSAIYHEDEDTITRVAKECNEFRKSLLT